MTATLSSPLILLRPGHETERQVWQALAPNRADWNRVSTTFSLQRSLSREMAAPKHIPKLHELPLQAGHPPRSAWGLWKEKDDRLGSLHWLSDKAVLHAVAEIKTGQRVTLQYG